jgi:large subunit ribosomal protein L3
MVNKFWGTKFNQLQTWTESGFRLPVTIIRTLPMTVSQMKLKDKDGYQAIQVSFGGKKREIRGEDREGIKVGGVIEVASVLKPGDRVKVAGISRGRGFTGVVKRWGFKGGPKTHGQSDRWRAPGSIGQGTDPGRVHKGKKMAGRMGGGRVTVRNLQIVKVDPEKQELWVTGVIPGSRGSLVEVTKDETTV